MVVIITMKRTNRREVITVSQRMLNFANLPEINSPKKVDEILCPDDPVGWNPLAENDFHGRASLVDLHELTQERLGELVSGGARTRKRILDKVVKDVRDASAQANVYGIIIPLPCVPEIVVDEGGAVMVRNQWLTTGAHAAVIFGLLELFVDGLVDDLARCNHCTHFYLQTPKLWIACSSACKQKLRLIDVAANVKELRRRRRRGKRRLIGNWSYRLPVFFFAAQYAFNFADNFARVAVLIAVVIHSVAYK